MNTASTPSASRPLRKVIEATPTLPPTTAIVPSTEAGSSSPNGCTPTTTRPANSAATMTASIEARPWSDQ
jgi:hypothetical protein